MRFFESSMQSTRKEWMERMATIQRQKIKWSWEDNAGTKYDGRYEGEIKDGRPHGLGKWEEEGNIWNRVVEGEWEDGLLNGRVIENWSLFGQLHRQEYEAKGGKRNGKFIQYTNDGSRA